MTGATGRRAKSAPLWIATSMVLALLVTGAGPSRGLAAQQVPFLSGRVNDRANLIADDREEILERELEAFELENGSQVVVLTVPDLGGYSVEQYALEVAETWQLGREGVDDGVLFLVSRDDRKLRIEVGYGAEGSLTDAESRRILDWIVVPEFRDGDFSEGIEAGVRAIMEELRGTVPPPSAPPAWMTEDAERRRSSEVRVALMSLALFTLFVLLLLSAARRRGRRRRAWSSRTGWGRPPIIIHSGRRGSTPRTGSSRPRPSRPRPSRPRKSRSGGFGSSFRGGGGRFGGGGASSGW